MTAGLIHPYPVVGLSFALGHTTGGAQETTATSTALIILDATTGQISGGDLVLGEGNDTTATITTADTENLTIDPAGTGTIFFHGATYGITSTGALTVASCTGCGGATIKSGKAPSVTEGTPATVNFGTSFSTTPNCVVSVDLAGSGAAIKGMAYISTSPSTSSFAVDWSDEAGGAGKVEDIQWMCTNAGNADIAEIYATNDTTVRAGDVVSLDPSFKAGVQKSTKPYERNLIGIVSSEPALTIGGTEGEGKWMAIVALVGRVPVRVSAENGPINVGDLLTSSSIPGVAMKATKVGPIIGQAMNAFNGESTGFVLAFVQNDRVTGVKVADLLPGLTDDSKASQSADLGTVALAHFIAQKELLAASADLSEIITDRLAAGLEVITPQVVTETVNLAQLTPLEDGGAITVALGESGEFVISGDDGTPAVVFDSEGNAMFAGTVTADKIRANQIEGLEFLVADELVDVRRVLSALTATPSATPAVTPFATPLATDTAGLVPASESAQGTTLAAKLLRMFEVVTSATDSAVEEILVVLSRAVFRNPVEFFADVFFRGRVTFNSDTAGVAVIPRSTTRVDVPFEKPYENPPIVTISLALKEATDSAFLTEGVQAAVAGVTTKGFTIVLNEPVPRDLEYNWVAITVKDPRRIVGKSIEEGISGLSGRLGETLGEQATVTPSATRSPDVPSGSGQALTPTPSIRQPADAGQAATPVLTPIPSTSDVKDANTSEVMSPPLQASPSGELGRSGGFGKTVTVLPNELGFVRVRGGPTVEATETGQIPSGATVPYDDVQYGWYRVIYNGTDGWVSETYVEVQP